MRCDPRGEREFQRHLNDWDRQLREIQAGKRAHLDTWNQLTYDLAGMIRDDHGRVQLDCKLGTYFHSLRGPRMTSLSDSCGGGMPGR